MHSVRLRTLQIYQILSIMQIYCSGTQCALRDLAFSPFTFSTLNKAYSLPSKRAFISYDSFKPLTRSIDREDHRTYFGGGLCTNSTPFSIFPFKPLLHASNSPFSASLILPRIFSAFSAPAGPNVTGTEK